MARMIDADELMKSIEDNCYSVSQKHNSIEKGMTLNGIKQCIEEQPTVDAEPIRHGNWIRNGVFCANCSECGKNSVDIGKYCSNCGAKMEEHENE